MPIFYKSKPLLNPEECWNDWIELGSLQKVREKYQFEGRFNPNTGRPPTESAIQKSAYMYAILHPEEAREAYYYQTKQQGFIPNEEEWQKRFYEIARLLYYQRLDKLDKFVEQHGLQKFAR